MNKRKTVYLKRTNLKTCSCRKIKAPNEDIYSLSCYEKRKLETIATVCDDCVIKFKVALKACKLVFINRRTTLTLPKFLEEIQNV